MISKTSHTLGGEGWPALDIAKRAENRNIFEVLANGALQVRAGSSRTMQERASWFDTPLTQRAEFTPASVPRAFWRGGVSALVHGGAG